MHPCFYCDATYRPCRCVGSCHSCSKPVRDADLCADCQVEADALIELAGEDRQLLALMAVVRWAVRGAGEREAA